ncbi:MAG: Do family serine endopeptidase [Henriciella sp.]|nr:Do family serine endopeptidase [Henriciella sp.]
MKLFGISGNALVAGLIGAGAMGALVWGPQNFEASANPIVLEAPAGAPLSFADLIESVSPAVVSVNVVSEREASDLSELERFFDRFRGGPADPDDEGEDGDDNDGPTREARSLGSGFFISETGYIVTNNHVVEDATEIEVSLEDGRELEAELVGTDSQTDLAVLKVKEPGVYPYVEFETDSKLRRGDWVVALGNPFGLGGTATAGILSADGRDLGNSNPYTDFLQIDAAINRGNSGGPTFDLYGRVIGVNTAIFSPTGGSVGIGFAIPSDLAKSVTDTLIRDGRVSRGWLGVTIQDVTPDMAEARGLSEPKGAIVADLVANSPAKKSGIKRGDIIIEVNGESVDDATATTRLVGKLAAGSKNDFIVLRNGSRTNVSVTVGERPEDPNADFSANDNDAPESEGEAEDAPLGITLKPLDDATRDALNLDPGEPGMIIGSVGRGSPFREMGVQAGMVILDVNGTPLTSVEDLETAIATAKSQDRDKVLMAIRVGQRTSFISVDIADAD